MTDSVGRAGGVCLSGVYGAFYSTYIWLMAGSASSEAPVRQQCAWLVVAERWWLVHSGMYVGLHTVLQYFLCWSFRTSHRNKKSKYLVSEESLGDSSIFLCRFNRYHS